MLTLEVEIEALIEHVVDIVLAGVEDIHFLRTRLINSVVKALEKDSDWVYLYDAADELIVPETKAESDIEETLHQVVRVRYVVLVQSYMLFIESRAADTPRYTS